MTHSIHPVVLCGGMGSRLWPMSRVEQPKQFQPVNGKGSLSFFQTTLQRHRGDAFHDPIVVTNVRQSAIVDRQMRELQYKGRVIAEPVGRNTGPAVLAAALTILRDDPDGQMLVLPSDHIIKGNLNRTILAMVRGADEGRIITFGIKPAYPETGYGYIVDGGGFLNYPGLHRVEQFVEKPPYEQSKELVASGFSYWASGISLFRADTLVAEFRRFDPNCYEAVAEAVERATGPSNRIFLDEAAFSRATNQPTERIVFERSSAIALAPVLDIEWDDVGAWNSVHQISDRDANGNVENGDVITLDTTNSFIQSDGRLIAVIGMHDVIIVETPDAILVAHRDHAQSVKKLVEGLIADDRPEVKSHVVRDTSWGQIETVSQTNGYDMRMLTIQPGASLRVNGTGIGPSLLTVVSGEGICMLHGVERTISRGHTLPIDATHALPLRNMSSKALRIMQMTFTQEDEGEAAPLLDAAAETSPISVMRRTSVA